MTKQANNAEFDIDFEGSDFASADKNADRITDGGPYVGQFPKVAFVKSENTGSKGMEFEFEAAQGGSVRFTLWTFSGKNNAKIEVGTSQVKALAYLMGVQESDIKAVPGKVRAYVEGTGWTEVDGMRYPALEGKPIGVVLQKEVQDNGYRWNLYGQFQPTSKLTASELRERKNKPEKLDKMLRGLKDKDSRSKNTEPGQPSTGAADNYAGV